MFASLKHLSPTRLRLEARGVHLVVTLDHAATKNALNEILMQELDAVLDAAKGDGDIRSLVLRGANGAFCAGADLKAALATLESAGGALGPLMDMNRPVGTLYAKLNRFPKPVIAVVEGPAFGGGFGMTCCADIVLAGPGALFALSETLLGLPPAQIAPYVTQRLGMATARRLGMSAMRLDGPGAQAVGLVDEAFDESDALEARLAATLNLIGKCAPEALAATKALLLDSQEDRPEAMIDRAAEAFATCMASDEGREGVLAFNEKRPAGWVAKL